MPKAKHTSQKAKTAAAAKLATAKREMACQMKSEGLPVATIVRITDLTATDIAML
jgi:hypothetical protein